MQNDKHYIARASVYALIITTIFVGAVTIVADLVPPLKEWLAATYGHHWVGKGIWTVGIFVVTLCLSAVCFRSKNTPISTRTVHIASSLAILASIAMFVFFVYETLNH